MGYKRQEKVYKLEFEGEDFEGLEVRAKGLSVGQLLEFQTLKDSSDSDASSKTLGTFASKLVSWNLEDDNGPVPATLEGVKGQDVDFIMAIVAAWVNAFSSVSSNLGKDSSSGVTFPEGSIPME